MVSGNDGSALPIRVVVAALVVLGGVLYVQQEPFIRLRPSSTEHHQTSPVEFQDVDAHLWER
jgi:hypothetical protein